MWNSNYRGEHALALTNGTTAAEKAEDKHDSADDDNHPGANAQRMRDFLVMDHLREALLLHLHPDADRQQRTADQLHTHHHLVS